uniref:histidine kinase n=1 Tax=termite gut metagenome TaxID=433724 RepID=S0DGP6_9ZZZZ
MKLQLTVRSINHAALLIALLVTLVVIISGSIVATVYHFFWWGLVIICVSTFIVTYLFTRLVIKRGNLIERATAEIAGEMMRLEEVEHYRREYLGNFAHEIKTPVFNVQGYVSTLLDGALEDENVNRRYLERAEKSVERIIDIITHLDEISRLESGELNLEYTGFDIVGLAREISDTLEREAQASRIRIFFARSTPKSLFVAADRKYVAQVLVNLISNSIKYGTAGGWTRISFVETADRVTVEVADNGEGIEQDDVPRVFERFFRTDASRSREKGGTGLGLAIVKHILEAHGQTISLSSELGVGSTFSFTLSRN